MELTRSNYMVHLEDLKEKLRNATFVAIDAEFTGLGLSDDALKNSLFDSGLERYGKLRQVVKQNTAPQIGLSIFRRDSDESKNKFHVDAYNAFVTEPSFASFNNGKDNLALSIEYKCAKFLKKCQFDFNAFMKESVPCLNSSRMKSLEEYLNNNPDFMKMSNSRYFDKKLFPEVISKYSVEQKRDLVQRLRGLSGIIDVISQCKLPVVAHNSALDLMYIYQLFCDDLPENYDEFKKSVKRSFHEVYDTKFMLLNCKKILNSHPAFKDNPDKDKLQSSSLYTAFLHTSQVKDKFSPEIVLGSTCYHFKDSLQKGTEEDLEVEENSLVHSPAFDACITGVLFLNISHIAARISKTFQQRPSPPSCAEIFENVQSWKDQIFVSRASILAIYLQGSDPLPNKPQWTEARSNNKIDFDQLRQELSTFGLIDLLPVSDNAFRFVALSSKSVKPIKNFLTDRGFQVKNQLHENFQKLYERIHGARSGSSIFYDRQKPVGL